MRIALILVGIIAAPALLPAPASAAGGLPTVSSPEEAVEVAIRTNPHFIRGVEYCVDFRPMGLTQFRPQPDADADPVFVFVNIPGATANSNGGGMTGLEGEYIVSYGGWQDADACVVLIES